MLRKLTTDVRHLEQTMKECAAELKKQLGEQKQLYIKQAQRYKLKFAYLKIREIEQDDFIAHLVNVRSCSHTAQQADTEQSDILKCKLCLENTMTHALLPCKHMFLCQECSEKVNVQGNTCPVCRREVLGTIKIYIA